jgi:hypothetical protein
VNPVSSVVKNFLTWLLLTMFHLASQGPIATFILAFPATKIRIKNSAGTVHTALSA